MTFRCFSAFADGENDYIALDDLGIYGFKIANRQKTLDLNHCILIMELLGKFHGLSIAMKDQCPEQYKKLENSLEEVYYADCYKDWYQGFQIDQIVATKDAVHREYPGTVIEEKMLNFIESGLFEKMVKLSNDRNKNSVISHGDCWTPNFMMTNDKNDIPTDMKMIDFQLARCSSPALDISFFIYSCTSQELRERHYEELLKAYHKSLSDLVRDLGSDPTVIFPYSELEKEMLASAKFGVGMGMESLPFSIMDDDDTVDLDTIEVGLLKKSNFFCCLI